MVFEIPHGGGWTYENLADLLAVRRIMMVLMVRYLAMCGALSVEHWVEMICRFASALRDFHVRHDGGPSVA